MKLFLYNTVNTITALFGCLILYQAKTVSVNNEDMTECLLADRLPKQLRRRTAALSNLGFLNMHKQFAVIVCLHV